MIHLNFETRTFSLQRGCHSCSPSVSVRRKKRSGSSLNCLSIIVISLWSVSPPSPHSVRLQDAILHLEHHFCCLGTRYLRSRRLARGCSETHCSATTGVCNSPIIASRQPHHRYRKCDIYHVEDNCIDIKL